MGRFYCIYNLLSIKAIVCPIILSSNDKCVYCSGVKHHDPLISFLMNNRVLGMIVHLILHD